MRFFTLRLHSSSFGHFIFLFFPWRLAFSLGQRVDY